MKNKLLLLLALMMFTFSYCHEKISVYKTDLKELKTKTTIFQKKFNGKIYKVKCEIGEAYLGNIAEITYQIIEGPDYDLDIYINKNKVEINKFYTTLTKNVKALPPNSEIETPALDALTTFGECVKKWCSKATTTSGAALCYADCALEAWG